MNKQCDHVLQILDELQHTNDAAFSTENGFDHEVLFHQLKQVKENYYGIC